MPRVPVHLTEFVTTPMVIQYNHMFNLEARAQIETQARIGAHVQLHFK